MGDRLGILGAVGLFFLLFSTDKLRKRKKIKRYAPSEARTHGLQIMRLTRCLLRYGGLLFPLLSPPVNDYCWDTRRKEMRIQNASAGNRTRINCLEGSYAHHYTTDASIQGRYQYGSILGKFGVKVKSFFKMSLPWPGFEPGLLRPQRRVLTTRRSRLETPTIVYNWVWSHTLKVTCKEGKLCSNYIQRTSFRGVAVITSA